MVLLLEPVKGVNSCLNRSLPPHERVQARHRQWCVLKDTYLAHVAAEGLLLDWIDGFDPINPLPHFRPAWWESRSDLPPSAASTIFDWLQQGIIKQVQQEDVASCCSVFVIPKKDSDEVRLITNLRNVNQFLQTSYFHLPTLYTIVPYLKQNMFATSVDIKGAYLHWPIHPRDRPHLCFEFAGNYFQHQALPFGLSVAPKEWQRAMQSIVDYMRSTYSALLWVYLDDFLLISMDPASLLGQTKLLVNLLNDLGIEVNLDKSELFPVQRLNYLGFTINLLDGVVEIPPRKITQVMVDIAQLLKSKLPSCRKVASVLGRLRSLIFAFPQVRLWTDLLQHHVHLQSQIGWEYRAPLPPQLGHHLKEALNALQQWKGRPLHQVLPQEAIFSDASSLGWGAVRVSGEDPIWGWFLPPVIQDHINLKETRALLESILVYNLKNAEVHVWTDSTTLFWYLLKWGGRSLQLNSLLRELWIMAQERGLVITPHWVPSQDNPADGPSRRLWSPLQNSMLHPMVVSHIFNHFASRSTGRRIYPQVDWMALDFNTQCPRHISPQQNIFAQNLDTLAPGWVNPPWALIPHLLNFWMNFSPKAVALAVLPYTPKAPWWGLRTRMQVGPNLFLHHRQGVFLDHTGSPLEGPPVPLVVAILQGINCAPSPQGPQVSLVG